MIGWTIFNCLCLGVCLIFMFGYDKEYLSNLLKYDATIIVYIFFHQRFASFTMGT